MLQLKPTEHLTGINLSGDYQDLNALRSAIFRVCGDENEYDGYEPEPIYWLCATIYATPTWVTGDICP